MTARVRLKYARPTIAAAVVPVKITAPGEVESCLQMFGTDGSGTNDIQVQRWKGRSQLFQESYSGRESILLSLSPVVISEPCLSAGGRG